MTAEQTVIYIFSFIELSSASLSPLSLVALVVLFFLTSVIGVVTGSNSLITVPVLYQFGIDPRVAVATNMFGLTFMSVGGALPFIGKGTIDRRRLPLLTGLTLAGSILGALLVLVISSRAMPLVISLSMIAVSIFTVTMRGTDAAVDEAELSATTRERLSVRARWSEHAGYAATFALGVYGGFFSGGYVTLLTAAFVALFRLKFIEAVSTTKIINVFSSLVATLIFMANGLVDYRLGAIISVVMFAGAYVGARLTLKMNERALRRLFLLTVVALALKILLYDFLWKGMK